jgi:hypothetical protein
MSGETNRGQGLEARIQRWKIRELGKALVQVFNDDSSAPVEVRRVQITAYDKHGWVLASSVVEEDATATNEQMSAAVVRMQEAMIRQHDDDQPQL